MKIIEVIDHFNEKLALATTRMVGTMWCVYIFTLLALFPLVVPKSMAVVQFVSSSLLQLILLPAIMVGSDLLNRKSEMRAQQDHEALMNEITMLRTIMDDDREERRLLARIAQTERRILGEVTHEKLDEIAEAEDEIASAINIGCDGSLK